MKRLLISILLLLTAMTHAKETKAEAFAKTFLSKYNSKDFSGAVKLIQSDITFPEFEEAWLSSFFKKFQSVEIKLPAGEDLGKVRFGRAIEGDIDYEQSPIRLNVLFEAAYKNGAKGHFEIICCPKTNKLLSIGFYVPGSKENQTFLSKIGKELMHKLPMNEVKMIKRIK